MLRSDPSRVDVLWLVARTVNESQGLRAAVPWFEKAAAADPRNPMPHRYLAYWHKERGQKALAIAMRAPNGEIAVHTKKLSGLYQSQITKIPFLRGVILLWDALGLGMRALTLSANTQTGEDEKLEGPALYATLATSLAISIGLFFLLPAGVGGLAAGIYGQANGFKLFQIQPGSLYSSIGIENGDVITRINGYEVNSPDKALEVYQKLRESPHVTIELERGGQPIKKDYNIKGP